MSKFTHVTVGTNDLNIDAFHVAALAIGGPDEGAPGTHDWAPNAYAADSCEPDRNRLAVYCFKEA